MSNYQRILSLFILSIFSGVFGQLPYLVGGDVSFLHRIENRGGMFLENGVARNALEIFRDHGYNTVRLRIWHSPPDGYSGLDTTLYLAQRANALGFSLLLDIHYSDTWADPKKQYKPKVWEGIPFPALVDSVYNYTFHLMRVFKEQGVLPEIVQVGNEITNGMLWPDGKVGGVYDTPAQWEKLGRLLKAAVRAIREAVPQDSVQVMIHIDRGGDYRGSTWFFDNLIQQSVEFDLIGLSYYPFWHGGLHHLQYNLENLFPRYGKELVVVETAYPWTLLNFDDTENLVSNIDMVESGYLPTPEGQLCFLRDLNRMVQCVPGGRGIVYWEPEYITSPGFGSVWENMALFDQDGEMLPAMEAFQGTDNADSCARFYARVTLSLNTASIPDTVKPEDLFQIRGAVDSRSPYTLSDSRIIDWSDKTMLNLQSSGGDYFTITLNVPVGRVLQFKFWSQAAQQLGLNEGWDLGESNEHPHGDTFVLIKSDTTLPLHFFNARGGKKPYDWRLWEPRADSIAVWLRVFLYTEAAVAEGYRPNDNTQSVSVLLLPGGEFDDTLRIPLAREDYNPGLTAYHLFSGVAYFPRSLVGKEQPYLFALDGLSSEEPYLKTLRRFRLPARDTTLHWVYYGDSPPVRPTAISKEPPRKKLSRKVEILGIYPNPFNPVTVIRFSLQQDAQINLSIFNLLGQSVAMLVNRKLPAGTYQVPFDGRGLPGGVYFCHLTNGSDRISRKILLLK